jgi:hypothetical protein
MNFVRSNASITVDVQYAPRLYPVVVAGGNITVNGVLEVPEGSLVNLTFEVDANPPVDASGLKWFRDGSLIGVGKYLAITLLRRQDAGEYRAMLTNTLVPSDGDSWMANGTGIVTLTVSFRPGNASITVVPNQIVTGSNVSLQCSVNDPGNPRATFVWTRYLDATAFPRESTLQLNNAALSDIGQYTCTPYNKIGAGQSASVILDVFESPSWLMPSLPSSLEIEVNKSTQSFQCVARGRPPPLIQWKKDGQLLNGSSWYTVINTEGVVDTYSFRVSSTLFLQGPSRMPTVTSLRPDDAGHYECAIVSDITAIMSAQSVNLLVRYAPIMSMNSSKMAIDANSPVQLLCRARATPVPTFVWMIGTSTTPLQDNSLYQITTWKNDSEPFPFVSTLTITSIGPSDLGVYVCRAQNEIGLSTMTFNVTVKTVPDAPRSLSVVSQTWESVQVSWQPGFNGGYAQDFIVLLYIPGSSSVSLNVSVGSALTYNLTALYPSTRYAVTVHARNLLGDGPASGSISAVTNDLSLEPPASIQYVARSRLLTFSPSTSGTEVCLRVRSLEMSKSSWHNYEPCIAEDVGSIELGPDVGDVAAIEVAYCVQWRQDICSPAKNVTIVTSSDVPVTTIIVVVCVCGGVIIILAIILTVLCCLRCRSRKQHSQMMTINLQPIGSPVLLNNHVGNSKLLTAEPSGYVGFDNPTMDSVDHFSDKISDIGRYYRSDPHTHDHMTRLPGSPPPYVAQTSPPGGSNGSDSGVSTPDTPKPLRRIIHEVVV